MSESRHAGTVAIGRAQAFNTPLGRSSTVIEALAFERARGETQRESQANGPEHPVGDLCCFSYNPRDRTTRKREMKSQ